MSDQPLNTNPTPPATSKQKDSLTVSNVAKLDVERPIPFETPGLVFQTTRGRDYIPFFDKGDKFFELLLEAKMLSPTTSLCVNSKTDYCIGEGWYLKNKENDPKLAEWAKVVNRKGDSLNDILKKGFGAYNTVGNAFIEIVRGKVGNDRYVKLIPRNFLDCRLSVPGDDDDDIPQSVYISKNFRRRGVWRLKTDEVVELPIYYGGKNQKWLKQKGNEHAIFHLKNETDGFDYYGMPSNVASLPQQLLEYKMARFNMDEFDNNLVIGGVIVLEGNVTQEEANKLGKQIIYQHSGDGKRGRYVVLAGQAGISNTKIIPYEKQSEGDFIALDTRYEEKIVAANQWDLLLAGIQRGTGIGNGSSIIRSVFDIKNNTVIKPIQKYFKEKFIQKVFEVCDEWTNSKFSQHDFDLKTTLPISFMGDVDINAIMTKDEGRGAIGLPALADEATGKTFIKESKQLNLFGNNVPDQQPQ